MASIEQGQKPINGVNYAVGYSFTLGVVGVEGGTVRRPQKGGEGTGRERGKEYPCDVDVIL